jgi:hypothetical protein
VGQVPAIDEHGLDFLDPDIKQACVAVGTYEDGAMHTRWSGRAAMEPVQMWSATKSIPMAQVVVKANQASPGTSLDRAIITDPRGHGTISVPAAFDAIVSYRQGDDASNQLARTLKQFDTPAGLEGWLHGLTGNTRTVFRGGYGEPPRISRPILTDGDTHKAVLEASGQDHNGDNLVSAYDLCRLMSLVGWNSHLPAAARLPGAQQAGIDTLVKGLGTDSARFGDVALQALNMQDRVQDPVILSKLGFGWSDTHHDWEQVYSAFIQFTDKTTHKPYSIALALRGTATGPSESALQQDARIATAVTLILDQTLAGQLG